MRYPRAGCAAVGLPPGEFGNSGGVVIVCGGWKNADTAVDTVEHLDLATEQWSLLPNMLTARAGCAAVMVDNKRLSSREAIPTTDIACQRLKSLICRLKHGRHFRP